MALCFPTSCLKFFIGIGSIITILIALGMLAATIYVSVQKHKILDHGDDINLADAATIGLYISSVLFLVMGISGLYGSIKKNKCLLTFFAIGTFLFIIIFLAGIFLFFLAPKTVFKGTCGDSNTFWVRDLQLMNAQAQLTLCQKPCKCDFINVNNIYNQTEVDLLTNKSSTGQIKVQNCPFFQSQNFSEGNTILMATLEAQLQCGGWCQNDKQIFQYYNNISSTYKPKQCCYNALKSFFDKNGITLGVGCVIAFAFALLNMVLICCLCFHPSKSGNRSDFYRRMVEDD